MKQFSAVALLLVLALAGCGGEQAPVEGDAATPADTTATEELAPAGPDDAAAADEEEEAPTQVLEESATIVEEQPENEPIKLARANVGEPERDWQFKEGTHFVRLVPTQPTVGGADKIEVAEVFWYGCPHCRDFERFINAWAERAPANVRFVRLPGAWNPLMKLHAQLYYTEQELVRTGAITNPEAFRAAVFSEYQDRRNRLASKESIQAFFERAAGVTAQQFEAAWNSYNVARQLGVAMDLTSASESVQCGDRGGGRYCIDGVPAMVVNGKYKVVPTREVGLEDMLAIVDELVERESLR